LTINFYQFYCSTEQAFIQIYSNTPPSSCPNGSSHSIVTNTIITLPPPVTPILIKQNNIEKGNNNYRVESKSFSIPANTIGSQIFTWPIDINVLTVNFSTDSTQTGDIINAYIAPNTTVGVLTSPVSAGSTIFNINPNTLNYLNIGYNANITNGTQNNNLGMVTSIDTTNLSITTQNSCSNPFIIGDYMQMTVQNICNFELGAPTLYAFGKKNILASHVPKNTPIQMTYQNNSSSIKKFVFYIEYNY
jgi:hypothetical protein